MKLEHFPCQKNLRYRSRGAAEEVVEGPVKRQKAFKTQDSTGTATQRGRTNENTEYYRHGGMETSQKWGIESSRQYFSQG